MIAVFSYRIEQFSSDVQSMHVTALVFRCAGQSSRGGGGGGGRIGRQSPYVDLPDNVIAGKDSLPHSWKGLKVVSR